MTIKKHWAQFLNIGRPVEHQIDSIERTKDRIKDYENRLRNEKADLIELEQKIFKDIQTVFSVDEILEAKEQWVKQHQS